MIRLNRIAVSSVLFFVRRIRIFLKKSLANFLHWDRRSTHRFNESPDACTRLLPLVKFGTHLANVFMHTHTHQQLMYQFNFDHFSNYSILGKLSQLNRWGRSICFHFDSVRIASLRPPIKAITIITTTEQWTRLFTVRPITSNLKRETPKQAHKTAIIHSIGNPKGKRTICSRLELNRRHA